jgi:uncharacterized protein (DUF488 family)
MSETTLFTIGFTQKSAETFFTSLTDAGVKRIVDIRLNNTSQLAAFAKRDDLAFFLKAIGDMEYLHRPDLAPTRELLDGYKKKEIDWERFEGAFLELCEERHIENLVTRESLDGACLLCSEPAAQHCHRRLAAEYLAQRWGGVRVVHL